MIRKWIARLLIVPVAVLGLLFGPVPRATDAYQFCNYTAGNFFGSKYQNGDLPYIVADCEITTYPHGDTNWGDSSGVAQGTDNNALESFRFYGRVGETYCLYLYTFVSYGDEWISYRVHNTKGGSLIVLPDSWDDVVTSHQVKRVTFSSPCVNP